MNYKFNKSDFIIGNYNKQSAFANFLPGLAGKEGIPLWAFYVNRGQGISGFGLHNKNHPIMEFTPANKAYVSVGQIGFRTFIKTNDKVYEPFQVNTPHHHTMTVRKSEFEIEETNNELGLKTTVNYFGLPNENLGAIVRKVKIENISSKNINLEVLDGIAEILPYGVENQGFKAMSNLLRSWFVADNESNDFAFYTLRSSTGDTAEVSQVSNGNFILASDGKKLVKPIVDPNVIFGHDLSKSRAIELENKSVKEILSQEQTLVNQIPCGFVPFIKTLAKGEALEFHILSGNTHSIDFFAELAPKLVSNEYITSKQVEASNLLEELTKDVTTSTNNPVFDEYIKQNYMDNLLRGGYPTKIGKHIFHLYARKHGDLERDYNFFSLAPEYYSTGDGNFRDVCQNRRVDSFVHSEVKDFNIKHFFSLVQLDGYNPLTVKPMMYQLEESKKVELVNKHFKEQETMFEFFNHPFTPGSLVNFVARNNIPTLSTNDQLLEDFMNHSKQLIESAWSEGYWSDHFDYLFDLIEVYLGIYPDTVAELLYEDRSYKTFTSPVTVVKQKERAVLKPSGDIRQYGSLLHHDNEKINKLQLNLHGSNWEKCNNEIYHTNLFTKLLLLVLNKHSMFDVNFHGIEMDGDKPGWNDAMNGVPGLFGSGVSEAIETLRIVTFLKENAPNEDLVLPQEVVNLYRSLLHSNEYFNRLEARETYRESVRFGLNGHFESVSHTEFKIYITNLEKTIKEKLEELYDQNDGILPTFIVHEVTKYEPLKNGNDPIIGHYGLPIVKPLEFKSRNLPKFLEAPARYMKTGDKDKLRKMYASIKESGIYDDKLKMYKTSESLDSESIESGRIRAFTKGWLERESNFLHMTYKYLLGLLKAGLYDEYYEEIKDNMVCFMDPEIYRRNTLENSSFIAPSNNPNKNIHGKGFFARLSGSTVEVVDMWKEMMTGGTPFKMVNGELTFKLEPKLHKSFFKKDKTVQFTFLKSTTVEYVNHDMVNTYQEGKITKYELDGKIIDGEYLSKEEALNVRNGVYNKVTVHINK